MTSQTPDDHGSYNANRYDDNHEQPTTQTRQAASRFYKDEHVLVRSTLDADQWCSLLNDMVIVVRAQDNAKKYQVRHPVWQRTQTKSRPKTKALTKDTLTVNSDQLIRVPPELLEPVLWDNMSRENVRPEAIRFGPNNEILELRVWRTCATLSPGQWSFSQPELVADDDTIIDEQEQVLSEQIEDVSDVVIPNSVRGEAFRDHDPSSHDRSLWNPSHHNLSFHGSPPKWPLSSNTTSNSAPLSFEQIRHQPAEFESLSFDPNEQSDAVNNSQSFEDLMARMNQMSSFPDPETGEMRPMRPKDLRVGDGDLTQNFRHAAHYDLTNTTERQAPVELPSLVDPHPGYDFGFDPQPDVNIPSHHHTVSVPSIDYSMYGPAMGMGSCVPASEIDTASPQRPQSAIEHAPTVGFPGRYQGQLSGHSAADTLNENASMQQEEAEYEDFAKEYSWAIRDPDSGSD